MRFLKTNSGKKGEGMPVVRNQAFYFKEGFCWSNVLTTYIKCRKKNKTVHSTESMTLFSLSKSVPEYYLICILNSSFAAKFVDSFVNTTSHFTTGDAKLVPIIIPCEDELKVFKKMYDYAIETKISEFNNTLNLSESGIILKNIQEDIDRNVLSLYGL